MNYLLLGGLGTVLVAGWRYVLMVWNYARSIAVRTIELHGDSAAAVMQYLRTHYQESGGGQRAYTAAVTYVGERGTSEFIALEGSSGQIRIFRKGWRVLCVRPGGAKRVKDLDVHETWIDPTTITFVRGTINSDRLVADAIEEFNNSLQQPGQRHRRYAVYHLTGTDGKPVTVMSTGDSNATPSTGHSLRGEAISTLLRRFRLLRWTPEQLDARPNRQGKSISRMGLSADMDRVYQECVRWYKSRQWFAERDLTWKRGYGLVGRPGTGKTSFVRAVAEDLDLPIFSYDLATLFNDELRRTWTNMSANTPCIALFEDIDTVFKGRENEEGHLTYGCLLNCLDGVQRIDGILTFLTTNRPEFLDDGLGGNGEGISARPGRIDEILVIGDMGEDARQVVARRILADCPEEIESAVFSGEGMTGAQFERYCSDLALQHFWGDHKCEAKITYEPSVTG